jgi:hypothetical protein
VPRPFDELLGLQRRAGNRAVEALLRSGGAPSGLLQRCGDQACSTSGCQQPAGEHGALREWSPQRGAADPEQMLRSPGRPLDTRTRAVMEPGFGHDFTHVRIHTDADAAAAAQVMGANAFTLGRHIAFAFGQYAPGTYTGNRLIAHELTHVLQQQALKASHAAPVITSAGDPSEREADANASVVMAGLGTVIPQSPIRPLAGLLAATPLQRQQAPGSAPRPTVGSGTSRAPGQVPRSPLPQQIDDRLHPDVRAQLQNDEGLRQTLLTIYARLEPEFWAFVPQYDKDNCRDKAQEECGITWIDRVEGIVFHLDDDALLHKRLREAGYTTLYFAKRDKDRWGLREPGVAPAGLHWHGRQHRQIAVHIDLHPPSGTGAWHSLQDDTRRKTTHTPETLRRGVERRGEQVPVLSEQEVHGQLTARLARLRSTMGGQPGLNAAQARLDVAAAIIWTQTVVSDQQLATANDALRRAAEELDQLENVAAPSARTAPR